VTNLLGESNFMHLCTLHAEYLMSSLYLKTWT
jgi:hypothetical protein